MALTKREIYLRSAFRRVWRWTSDERKAIKKKGICEKCGKKNLKGKALHVDHINAVVDPQQGFVNWQVYHDRMFSPKLAGLCVPCHKLKSKAENQERRKRKKKE